jgi:hypothetical protein
MEAAALHFLFRPAPPLVTMMQSCTATNFFAHQVLDNEYVFEFIVIPFFCDENNIMLTNKQQEGYISIVMWFKILTNQDERPRTSPSWKVSLRISPLCGQQKIQQFSLAEKWYREC